MKLADCSLSLLMRMIKGMCLNGGPYQVFGQPLILRAMPKYFEFSTSEMHTIPVWVKFPSLPII
jgi:hypothetical protein